MAYVTPADVGVSDNWQDHMNRSSAEPGTDYGTAYGTNLRAPESGVVIGVDRDPGGPAGRRLTLLLDDGRVVDWIHLSEIWVNVGDRFSRGQTGLALSGASRYGVNWPDDMGPHVHVTLRADRGRPFADTLNFEDYVGGGSGGWSDQDKQDFLDSLGYDTGAPGWGAKCEAATNDLQSKTGLKPDGDFGPATNGVAQTIKAGRNDTSRPTREIQTALKAAKFDPGAIDDSWGNKTSFAEYRWQLSAGLTADAIHGPASDARMFPATPTLAAHQRQADGDGVKGRTDATKSAAQIAFLDPNDVGDFDGWKRGEKVDGEDRWVRGAHTGAWFWLGGLSPRTVDGLTEVKAGTTPVTPVPATPKFPQPTAPTYPGATRCAHSPSSEPRNGQKVKWFIVHHRGDKNLPSAAQWWDADMRDRGDQGVSPTWAVSSDGSVAEMVPPDDFRPWASGKADFNAVAVETQNTSGAPAWGISDASHEAIAQLAAWSAKRYGFPIDRDHVFGDREITAKTGIQTRSTECPGPSMDLDRIVKRAQEIATPKPDPEPTTDLSGIAKLLQQILDLLKRIFGGGK